MVDAETGSTANKYTIVAKLATGGMAEIYLARNESTAGVERYVVLKRVLRDRANDINFVNMFLDEARLSARLQHPNIAQVYDTGTLGDSYFFTMEYVHGETVRNILHEAHAAKQSVPIATALTIIAGAAAGLQHAHERVGFDGRPLGIVHRDVTPSNLMVSYEGHVKLVDFGVAKATHRAQETQTGAVKGKVGYMSPEQIRNMALDARSDLFSLGIVMWELLAGDRLFKRSGDFQMMEAIVSETAPPPSTRRAGISPDIDAITCKLLQKSPAARYQSAFELLEALEDATVRAGLSLSVSGVRRYMRDLFGERVEPWVELARHDGHTDGVTVTGEKYSTPQDNETLSAQLEHVLDLSALWPSVPALGHGPDDDVDDELDEVSDGDLDAGRAPSRAAVRAAAISTTTPTVADAHLPPPLPPAVAIAERSERAVGTELLARRWLPARSLLLGGGVVVCAVIGFVLASGDGTAETIDRSQHVETSPPTASPVLAPATTAITEPAAVPPTVDAAPPPEPRPVVEQRRNVVREPVPAPPQRRVSASKKDGKHVTPPSPPRGDTPVVEQPPRPQPSVKTKPACDESDPMACRQ